MSVKLAETAGFCMGVKRAMDRILDIARHPGKGKIYTYGPLIHNPQTVDILKKRGITPVADIDDIPGGEDAVLVIRTHGVTPEERKKIKSRGFRIVDATCPKVAHVQAIIKKYVARGYTIIIVGDKGHPEVTALLGYAAGRGQVVSSREEARKLSLAGPVGMVAQTTQDQDFYDEVKEIIKEKMPQAVAFDTICDSTGQRQKEVKELAAQMDAMVIVGGADSANTKRLAEISEHQGTPTLFIETAEDLQGQSLREYKKIGVSAGASTPNWIIDRVVNAIAETQAQGGKSSKVLHDLGIFLVRTDIYSALGAGCLYLACALLQRLPLSISNFFISSLYIYAMHVLNRFTDRKTNIIGSFREEIYLRQGPIFISLSFIALLSALLLAIAQGMIPFLLLLAISILGILYNTPILPRSWRYRSLKELPASKNLAMALAWAVATAVLPLVSLGLSFRPGTALAAAFAFGMVLIRSIMADIIDIQNDRLVGRETIPVILGPETSKTIVKVLGTILFALLITAYLAGWSPSVSLVLLVCPFYVLICFKVCDRRAAFSGMELWVFLESSYILAGVSALIWLFITGYPF